ncbi:MAG: DUF2851 family protein [Candidatus Cloacimonetes bacterium]|nr:DUF2851 family protein [Candidatus Cloacimonadota bacterium]
MKEYIAENFLYHIWDEQHLKDSINTESGEKLKILFQGKWNTDAGPDFVNSIILLNDTKLQGDIEIHRHEYDWKAHNHHEDSRYNNVILHVVFSNDQNAISTISENGTHIPIFELQHNLDQQIEKLWKRYGHKPFDTSQQKTIECLLINKIEDPNELHDILTAFGKDRFQKKCKRFSAELYNSDFNQILFEGILEALGYGKNKMPFLKLAKLLPYQKLKSFMHEIHDLQDVFSILVYTSGLNLNKYNFNYINEDLIKRYKKVCSLLKSSSFTQLQENDWNFFRCRPQNHPINRLLQIAPFLFETLKQGTLINPIIALFSYGDGQTVDARQVEQDFIKLINKDEHTSIGNGRSRDIFANIILPISFVYAQTLTYDKLMNVISHVYCMLPKLSEHYITSYISTLLQKGINFKINLLMQQGMIQLYYQFCSKHECDNCIANLQ